MTVLDKLRNMIVDTNINIGNTNIDNMKFNVIYWI